MRKLCSDDAIRAVHQKVSDQHHVLLLPVYSLMDPSEVVDVPNQPYGLTCDAVNTAFFVDALADLLVHDLDYFASL